MSASIEAQRGRSSSVLLPRLVLISLLLITIFLPSLLQPALSHTYTTLYHSPLYRFSGFETLETVFFYALIEVLFTYKFGRNPQLRLDVRAHPPRDPSASSSVDGNGRTVTPAPPKTKPKVPKMRRPSKRMGEMFVYVAPLLLMDFTMIKKFAGVSVQAIRVSGNYPPLLLVDYYGQNTTSPLSLTNASTLPLLIFTNSSPPPDATISISSSFLLPTLHNFTLNSPLQLTRALPPPSPHPPTSRRLTLELLTALLLYDSLFFLFHLALHRLPLLSPLHLPHHAHAEMHPQVTNRLTVFERLALVLLANFSLNIIGAHVLTRTLFVPVFVYLLVEVHSGLDLEWGYEKVLPRGWGAGSRAHARHHRSGGGGLAPFFRWCDVGLRGWDAWWEGGKVARAKVARD